MASIHVRWCFYLAISSHSVLSPSEASRAEFESEIHAHDESWKFSCPQGLRANATSRLCYFDLDDNFGKEEVESIFESTGSTVPIAFNEAKYAGGILAQHQFLSEMAATMKSNVLKDAIIGSLMVLEMKKNASFRQQVHERLKQAHELSEDMKPAEFLFVHAGLHLVLEGAAHGLHALAAQGAVAAASEAVAAMVPIIGWALLVPMAAYDAYTARKHYILKTHHAKDFASRLVFKSDCLQERTDVTQARSHNNFSHNFSAVCGLEAESHLVAQVQRSMHQMSKVFEALEDVGRCIWPHGNRRWTKANCATAIFKPLREYNGKPGLLFEAIAFSASYAAVVDDMIAEPIYVDLFREYFGIDLPPQVSSTASLHEAAGSSAEDKVVACMSVVAMHRAYERMFMRLALAVKVWMHTFARNIFQMDVRTRHVMPCQMVFHKFLDRDKGLCKNVEFKMGHGKAEQVISEESPCEKAKQQIESANMSRGLWLEDAQH